LAKQEADRLAEAKNEVDRQDAEEVVMRQKVVQASAEEAAGLFEASVEAAILCEAEEEAARVAAEEEAARVAAEAEALEIERMNYLEMKLQSLTEILEMIKQTTLTEKVRQESVKVISSYQFDNIKNREQGLSKLMSPTETRKLKPVPCARDVFAIQSEHKMRVWLKECGLSKMMKILKSNDHLLDKTEWTNLLAIVNAVAQVKGEKLQQQWSGIFREFHVFYVKLQDPKLSEIWFRLNDAGDSSMCCGKLLEQGIATIEHWTDADSKNLRGFNPAMASSQMPGDPESLNNTLTNLNREHETLSTFIQNSEKLLSSEMTQHSALHESIQKKFNSSKIGLEKMNTQVTRNKKLKRAWEDSADSKCDPRYTRDVLFVPGNPGSRNEFPELSVQMHDFFNSVQSWTGPSRIIPVLMKRSEVPMSSLEELKQQMFALACTAYARCRGSLQPSNAFPESFKDFLKLHDLPDWSAESDPTDMFSVAVMGIYLQLELQFFRGELLSFIKVPEEGQPPGGAHTVYRQPNNLVTVPYMGNHRDAIPVVFLAPREYTETSQHQCQICLSDLEGLDTQCKEDACTFLENPTEENKKSYFGNTVKANFSLGRLCCPSGMYCNGCYKSKAVLGHQECAEIEFRFKDKKLPGWSHHDTGIIFHDGRPYCLGCYAVWYDEVWEYHTTQRHTFYNHHHQVFVSKKTHLPLSACAVSIWTRARQDAYDKMITMTSFGLREIKQACAEIFIKAHKETEEHLSQIKSKIDESAKF
jgi:hypothetical protein